jgi:hypothetical protein
LTEDLAIGFGYPRPEYFMRKEERWEIEIWKIRRIAVENVDSLGDSQELLSVSPLSRSNDHIRRLKR